MCSGLAQSCPPCGKPRSMPRSATVLAPRSSVCQTRGLHRLARIGNRPARRTMIRQRTNRASGDTGGLGQRGCARGGSPYREQRGRCASGRMIRSQGTPARGGKQAGRAEVHAAGFRGNRKEPSEYRLRRGCVRDAAEADRRTVGKTVCAPILCHLILDAPC